MKYIADLHIHSPFSRATSQKNNLAGLFAWAQVKGIHLVGSADFTHPGWLSYLKDNLIPEETGLFRLKEEKVPPALKHITPEPISVRFVLTTEISSIYKKNEKVRKVHNILFVPDFDSVSKINTKLASLGNIESDGRPILGLDSRDLLEILMEKAPQGFLVPAHIWTPWFSLFGSKSGFDSIKECFEDLSKHVFALETGLSSDPDMNRLVSSLDGFALISNSDCHSPSKLGREANLFDTGFDFFSMREALKAPLGNGFQGTIEFFPEEGKYHFDGHRKCHVCLAPKETLKKKAICPNCNRPLTIGVMHRVMELADRNVPYYPQGSPSFQHLIPLTEVLGGIMETGPNSKSVLTEYTRVINLFGSEFNLLIHTPIEEVNHRYSPILGEAIKRIRTGKVIRNPGYDGEFGIIKVFDKDELNAFAGQLSFFGEKQRKRTNTKSDLKKDLFFPNKKRHTSFESKKIVKVNFEQAEAIAGTAKNLLISAGPGTGKTFTLVSRMVRIFSVAQISPAYFVAITFTNKAADEVRARFLKEVGPSGKDVFIDTFHHFCLNGLRQIASDVRVIGEEARNLLLKNLFPSMLRKELAAIHDNIREYFHHLAVSAHDEPPAISPIIQQYLDGLEQHHCIDLDAIIPYFAQMLKKNDHVREKICRKIRYLFIDEFQDLNYSQYEIVKILSQKADVFSIGDPNQAIYGFRGCNLKFFYDFAEELKAKQMALIRNYRSAPAILEAATAVIAKNIQKSEVALIPQRKDKTLIEHYIAPTSKAEAELVVSRIEELIGGISHFSIHSGRGGEGKPQKDKSFADIAVLYRLSQQAKDLIEALERRGIPHQTVGASPFFMKSVTRGVYDWIRAASDEGAAEHIPLLKKIKGIGETSVLQLERELPIGFQNFWNSISEIKLPTRIHDKVWEVRNVLQGFKKKASNDLKEALKEVMIYLDITLDHPDAKRLLELAGAFGKDLDAFSHYLEQNAKETVYDENAEAVTLMTLHAAKGLEFPVVFITGMEDGLIPCQIPGKTHVPEEERRLFYVGMTRAQENLILTSSKTRILFGKNMKQHASPFVAEIPEHLLKKTEDKKKFKKEKPPSQLKLFS